MALTSQLAAMLQNTRDVGVIGSDTACKECYTTGIEPRIAAVQPGAKTSTLTSLTRYSLLKMVNLVNKYMKAD